MYESCLPFCPMGCVYSSMYLGRGCGESLVLTCFMLREELNLWGGGRGGRNESWKNKGKGSVMKEGSVHPRTEKRAPNTFLFEFNPKMFTQISFSTYVEILRFYIQ